MLIRTLTKSDDSVILRLGTAAGILAEPLELHADGNPVTDEDLQEFDLDPDVDDRELSEFLR